MDGNDRLRAIIAQGYVAMFLLMMMMTITDLVELGMAGSFSRLLVDPGTEGLWALAVVACVNVAAQLAAHLVQRPAARWVLFALTAAYTLFFVGHQASHLLAGEGFEIHSLLDFSHHGAGIVASISAFRLARSKAA